MSFVKRSLLMAVPALGLTVATFSPTVLACTNPGYYFDGMNTSIIVTQGAQAEISRYDPRICQSSSAWSMMDNQSNGNELAQIGWLKLSQWSTSTVYYFYEYGQSSSLNPPVMLSAVSDPTGISSDKFTVFTNGSDVTEFLINDSLKFSVTLNWKANNAQWLAETHSYTDQTAGDTNNNVLFNNVQHLYSGNWYNDNAQINADNTSPYGSGEWPNSNYCFVWDTRYSSEA